jgi:hypothetical protein
LFEWIGGVWTWSGRVFVVDGMEETFTKKLGDLKGLLRGREQLSEGDLPP